MAHNLPGVVSLARLKAPTKAKQERLFEVLRPLHDQCRDDEPHTSSYYMFTGTSDDDHAIYSFEGYKDMSALSNVHAKSRAMGEVGTIVKDESLCTMDFNLLTPLEGFLLRPGQPQRSAEVIVVNKFNTEEDKQAEVSRQVTEYVNHVLKEEVEGCPTFVTLNQNENRGIWTFERYVTKAFYDDQHCGSEKFKQLSKFNPATEIYQESGIGFLQK